jgi:hypothetical protein
MARKRRLRFGLPIVFAGRPSVGGVGLGCQPILPDSVLSDSKSPRRIFRRGLKSCDDEDMQVICPTCQNVFAGSLKRPDHATLHGVVLDIFVDRPIHGSETMLGRSDSGQAARRAQQRGVGAAVQRWVDDASPIHPDLIATRRLSRLPLRPRIR